MAAPWPPAVPKVPLVMFSRRVWTILEPGCDQGLWAYSRIRSTCRLGAMDGSSSAPETEALSVHDCWKYLRSTSTCRIAVVAGGNPEIFPVNFVPNYGTVIFRTGPGTKLDAVLSGGLLALEADGFNAYGTIAWSVVVKGFPELVAGHDDIQEAVEAGLSPWEPGSKDRLVRVTPTEISGRRFVINAPTRWWPALDSTSSRGHGTSGQTS
ncbi:pyridoxamine 5'-phosphate oxidase family protein [Arthrobacter sp. 4R501]|uniref:pyridoxamine 5'-phosphate oxidase family protein n=1 Tax=Arthrobacter sp. 4R501 TaxID=2058886 RepID=UPI0028006FAF|nr:pyridoxamine 5'-phosphate oxidase family protein [Arthrobacter sp. 4R501]